MSLDELKKKCSSIVKEYIGIRDASEAEACMKELLSVNERYHELLALCINRGKLFRVNAVTSNKKWDKRKDLYKNVVLSFVPRGY